MEQGSNFRNDSDMKESPNSQDSPNNLEIQESKKFDDLPDIQHEQDLQKCSVILKFNSVGLSWWRGSKINNILNFLKLIVSSFLLCERGSLVLYLMLYLSKRAFYLW